LGFDKRRLYIINGGHRHSLKWFCDDQFNGEHRCPTQKEL
jgi:hypothetical protein